MPMQVHVENTFLDIELLAVFFILTALLNCSPEGRCQVNSQQQAGASTFPAI